jgi:hypothetical protein
MNKPHGRNVQRENHNGGDEMKIKTAAQRIANSVRARRRRVAVKAGAYDGRFAPRVQGGKPQRGFNLAALMAEYE